MNKVEERYRKYHRKVTVEKLKNDLKRKFITNIKNSRETYVDKHRNFVVDQISIDIVRNEIQDSLIRNNYELEDIEQITKEIEEDSLLDELNRFANEYLAMEENLINETVKTHLNACTICEEYFESHSLDLAVICDKCVEINFKDMKCDS